MQLQRLLEEHNYNTVGNFLAFYRAFKRSGCTNVHEFFQAYSPPITPTHYTCVGLALELWNRLRTQLDCNFLDLGKHLFLVSCEENIESINEYTALYDSLDTAAYSLEKEHVLLCLKFEIAGRPGLLLCDPGYHVARVVTVMYDNAYPSTGWFIQSQENNIMKEYNYQFSPFNDKFVEWNERTTRNGVQETFTGLIYVARPYISSVDVTERRNLVYTFRSLLSRDQKGHLIAGIYFKVKENADEFTIFYQNLGKKRTKMCFSSFLQAEVSPDLLEKVAICNDQLNLPVHTLLNLIKDTGILLNDTKYLRQCLEIEQCINVMSADN